jgi:hypothetical protein
VLRAGDLLIDGVDPGRKEWKAWCSLRDTAAEQWCPTSLKPVAFILNKVRAASLLSSATRPGRLPSLL